MRSVKLSGTLELTTSRQAPVSDRLRTKQSIEGALPNEIEPPLNVRCRCLLRCSSIRSSSFEKEAPAGLAGASLLSQGPRPTRHGCGRSNRKRLGNYENGTRQNRPVPAKTVRFAQSETGHLPWQGSIASEGKSEFNSADVRCCLQE